MPQNIISVKIIIYFLSYLNTDQNHQFYFSFTLSNLIICIGAKRQISFHLSMICFFAPPGILITLILIGDYQKKYSSFY